MPYCPKCDMEFVDGITVCSDCGGPLLTSREEAEKAAADVRQQEEEKQLAGYGQMMEEDCSDTPVRPDEAMKKAAEERAVSRAYLSKRQRYEDLRSSVSAFLLVGVIFAAAALLCWVNVIKLPLGTGSLLLFKIVLTVLGLGSLVIAFVTRRSAAAMAKAADEEDARTADLVNWFVSSYTAAGLDEELLSEDADLDGNELYLKRFELIQDHLVTNQDLPNQDYVDLLCEEIYGRVFEG